MIPENTVNGAGYRALANNDTARAIEIFEFNVKNYPRSANVYDSLGEALEADGQLEKARRNYELAVEKGEENSDLNLSFFKQHLENLQAKLR